LIPANSLSANILTRIFTFRIAIPACFSSVVVDEVSSHPHLAILLSECYEKYLAVLNKENYTEGLKTNGKWLSDKERQEENGIVKQSYFP